MKKFMHRTDGYQDIDPLHATERTVFYDKSKSSQILKIETISSENEIEELKETIKNLSKDLPKSLKEFSEPTKCDMKLNLLKEEIMNVKKSHTKIKQKLNHKSKSLKNTKTTLILTQKKLNEVMHSKFQEFETKKLAIIGKMSSKMAHDIRNPLTVLQANMDLMKMKQKVQEDDIAIKYIVRMENAIFQITNQINDVLGFIKKPEIVLASCDLKEIVNNSIAEVTRSKYIDLELSADSCIIQCDVMKIRGIITNIIQNSVQAIGVTGKIDVMINEYVGFVKISIQDSGSGIPEENLEKIFEPMFTTKSMGTGLGLASCKQILEMHGGSIDVKNNPTTFTITLPKTKS